MRAIVGIGLVLLLAPRGAAATVAADDIGEGTLLIASDTAEVPSEVFPLEDTRVDARIAGFVAEVTVRQTFNNPFPEALEAIYVFPLPQDAAVGAMSIRVGDRRIEAVIKTRQEARETYDEARRAGKTTALLDQERPNIFTQSVANIPSGAEVVVEITYDVRLDYDDGVYEFVYPMVVGPRYIPGTPGDEAPEGGGRVADTDRVPDASRITPPVREPGSRSGHDVTIDVTLDGGVPVEDLDSPTHTVTIDRAVADGRQVTEVALAPAERIPNQDFVIRYRVGDEAPAMSVLTHEGERGGHLALLVDPPAAADPDQVTPKEIVFVVDSSGSMSGEPMSLSKRAMRHALENLNPADTFQIVRFSDRVQRLEDRPLDNTPDHVRRGVSYVNGMRGGGGTDMLAGVRAALDEPVPDGRLRIVCFMTDGYIGNEREILAAIERRADADVRVFPVGVGSSVNRHLIERMADVGRGAALYMLLDEPPAEQVEAFYERVRSPVLTHIEIDWNGLDVIDVTPARVPDLFAGEPLALAARYRSPGEADVRVRARRAGEPVTFTVPVALRGEPGGNEALSRLWARARIEELMARQYDGETPDVREAITELALRYALVTRYTSFVAVAEEVVNEDGVVRTYQVPVEMPNGVSYEGVFGADEAAAAPTVGRTTAESYTADGLSLDVAAPARPGSWRIHVGLGLGALAVGRADDQSGVVPGIHAGLDRVLTRELAIGARAALLLPGLDGDTGLTQLLLRAVLLDVLDGLLELSVGAGASLGLDAPDGVGYSGAVEMRLPFVRGADAGVGLRYDGAHRFEDGADEIGVVSLGLELSF